METLELLLNSCGSTMDCRSFFQRQRDILFAPASGSGATIGQQCIIIEIDPTSKYLHPTDATHWRVRVFLPHVPEYRDVYGRDLIGLQERDDSPLPSPSECVSQPKENQATSKSPPKWVESPLPATSRTVLERNGMLAAAVFAGLLWVYPYAAFAVAAVALLIFAAAIFGSAIRHRQRDWWLGILFCVILITVPLWVAAANSLFEQFLCSPTSIP